MRLRDTDFDFIGLPVRRRLLMSVPFLSTGGALAVFILTGISLRVGMIVAAVLVTGAVVLARTRLPEPSRRLVCSQAVRGTVAGHQGYGVALGATARAWRQLPREGRSAGARPGVH